MIEVTGEFSIPESELEFEFVLSGGPGGQKVNKTASAVMLRFDALSSPSLPDEVKCRLPEVAGSLLNSEGVLVIHSRKYRSQSRNRDDAVARLVGILRKAAVKPARRKRTGPTMRSIRKRLEDKRRRGRLKKERGYSPSREEPD